MENFNFDVQELNGLIEAQAAQTANRQNREEYTKTSYLPDGSHVVSISLDPEKELFRRIAFHKPLGSKLKCLCPDDLNKGNKKNPNWADFVQSLDEDWKTRKLTELPACEICKANVRANEINKNSAWHQKLGVNYNHLIYMTLYRTSAPGEYWEPNEEKGTPYAVIGTTKLRNALNSLLESLRKTAGGYLTKALNPTFASPPFMINSTRGTQGSVNVSTSPEDAKPAVVENLASPPSWWKPLKEVFIKPEFNLEDYETVVKTAQDLLEKFEVENSGKSGVDAQITDKSGVDEAVGNFLTQAKAVEAPVEKFEIRAQVQDHAPLTTEEKSMKDTGELQPNQRLSKTGTVVTLPQYAVDRNCFTEFNSTDPLCLKCDANLECAFSQD